MIVTAFLLLAAQAAAPLPAATAAKPLSDPDRRVCRREVVTGSNMPTRVCKTRAEWQHQEHDGDHAMDQLRGPAQTCRGTSC